MKKVTVILAHQNLENSVANKQIIEQLKKKMVNVEIRDIFKLYPNFKIDAKAEQDALLDSDVIVFQFPFLWYNVPAILKQWFDDVFAFNFAFGPEGDKLKGKSFILSITIGGPGDAYTPLGYNHFRVEEFLKPLEQSAYLAQMNYLPPVYGHGMIFIPGVYNTREAVEKRAINQADHLIGVIEGILNDNPENMIREFVKEWFAHLESFAENGYFNQYLSNNARIVFPEGEYLGHEGFNEWYGQIKTKIKAGSDHLVESINISANGVDFEVQLTVKFTAETHEGQKFQSNLKETWKMQITRDKRIKIHEYLTEII